MPWKSSRLLKNGQANFGWFKFPIFFILDLDFQNIYTYMYIPWKSNHHFFKVSSGITIFIGPGFVIIQKETTFF